MTPIPLSDSTELPGKIAIVGANGLLGWELARWFSRRGPSVALDRAACDITDADALARVLDRERPSVVCNAAGFTTVDLAETERDRAFALNTTGPTRLAQACAERAMRLVHFSTDQVFDGTLGVPMRESETPHPLNYYARTKLEGEAPVLESGGLVLRVQWLYGERKNRFAVLREKPSFNAIIDQFGAVTWTLDIAAVVDALLCRRAAGLFHMAYDDWASWAQIFEFVRDHEKLPIELIPTKTASLNLPAKRPAFSVMSNEKLKKALGVSSLGTWRERLREFLNSSRLAAAR